MRGFYLFQGERRRIAVAGIIISALLLAGVIYFFYRGMIEEKKLTLSHLERTKSEIAQLAREYKQFVAGEKAVQRVLQSRTADFNILSVLEKKAKNLNLRGYIKSMTPAKGRVSREYEELIVSMNMEGVTLRQLLQFLEQVEAPEELIRIKEITINRSKLKKGYLDVDLQIVSLVKPVYAGGK
jgi:hypothetical protein